MLNGLVHDYSRSNLDLLRFFRIPVVSNTLQDCFQTRLVTFKTVFQMCLRLFQTNSRLNDFLRLLQTCLRPAMLLWTADYARLNIHFFKTFLHLYKTLSKVFRPMQKSLSLTYILQNVSERVLHKLGKSLKSIKSVSKRFERIQKNLKQSVKPVLVLIKSVLSKTGQKHVRKSLA